MFFLVSYAAQGQSASQKCQAEAVFEAYKQDCPAFSKESYCIEFISEAAKPNPEKKVTYLWDMGDGQQKRGIHCTHCYDLPGTYLTTLYVTTQVKHGTFTDTLKTEVAIENIVSIEYNYSKANSKVPQVFFDASKSFISNDFIASDFLWDFGDGSYQCDDELVFHAYPKKGAYRVRLIIKGMLNGKEEWICSSQQIQID